ncbi:hypothetical protein [Pseudomonas sp. Hp2]|uniref:hypothetical protein n=1 Tax=Pseudomonas sp. Hp2 TaxID=701189 RepID=UPI00112C64F7|nr:hypothetical protein [Pseudomonas sp. Hp2]
MIRINRPLYCIALLCLVACSRPQAIAAPNEAGPEASHSRQPSASSPHPASGEASPAGHQKAGKITQAALDFIEANYDGVTASASGDPDVADSGMRLCASERHGTENFAALCGSEPGGEAQVDLYVLSDDGDLLASTTGLPGKGTDVEVFSFGIAGQHHGFLLEAGDVRQGLAQRSGTLYLRRGDELASTFTIALEYGKNLDCRTGDPNCTRLQRLLRPATGFDGMEVVETGVKEGQQVDRTYPVRFDAKAVEFSLPEALRTP